MLGSSSPSNQDFRSGLETMHCFVLESNVRILRTGMRKITRIKPPALSGCMREGLPAVDIFITKYEDGLQPIFLASLSSCMNNSPKRRCSYPVLMMSRTKECFLAIS
jgi:hypothetical protein